MIRRAFYNLYVPGCIEHYLVRIMRGHRDFIPELDLVIELDGKIIGSIMYTKARLVDETGTEKEILTFGPVCIEPGCQRRGYGKVLMEYSFKKALSLGYDVIVIFGSPAMEISEKDAEQYDDSLEKMEKSYRPSQEEFYIMSHSFID